MPYHKVKRDELYPVDQPARIIQRILQFVLVGGGGGGGGGGWWLIV